MLLIPARARLPDGRSCMNLLLTAPREAAMDETGMSYADKVEFVDDVLRTWGEEAAQEVAERYALICRRSSARDRTRSPILAKQVLLLLQ